MGGRAYKPPESSTRRGISPPLSPGEWQALTEAGGQGEPGPRLLEEVAFTSPLNLPGLLAGGDPGLGTLPPEELVGSEAGAGASPLVGYALWERLRRPDATHPCLLETTRGRQPYPFQIPGLEHTPAPDLLSALRTLANSDEEGGSRTGGVEREVERFLVRARKKVAGLRKEMDQAKDPQEPREMANLLLARLHQVPRGSHSITLEGFSGEAVVVSLDPSLGARENAEALYAEAARRERAKARLPALLTEAEGRVRKLESLQERLQEGTLPPEEARRQLPESLVKAPGKKQGQRLPYRVYRSSGGLEIRVGRGSRENDALTFKHSRPLDVWLHARDASGAHVVLRWGKEETPPGRDLEEAAVLAALHSGSRQSATVPVDWTFRKYVRKARKAPPGTVIPSRVQTLFVGTDAELPNRLKEPDPSPP